MPVQSTSLVRRHGGAMLECDYRQVNEQDANQDAETQRIRELERFEIAQNQGRKMALQYCLLLINCHLWLAPVLGGTLTMKSKKKATAAKKVKTSFSTYH